jgi:hypothetical protein
MASTVGVRVQELRLPEGPGAPGGVIAASSSPRSLLPSLHIPGHSPTSPHSFPHSSHLVDPVADPFLLAGGALTPSSGTILGLAAYFSGRPSADPSHQALAAVLARRLQGPPAPSPAPAPAPAPAPPAPSSSDGPDAACIADVLDRLTVVGAGGAGSGAGSLSPLAQTALDAAAAALTRLESPAALEAAGVQPARMPLLVAASPQLAAAAVGAALRLSCRPPVVPYTTPPPAPPLLSSLLALDFSLPLLECVSLVVKGPSAALVPPHFLPTLVGGLVTQCERMGGSPVGAAGKESSGGVGGGGGSASPRQAQQHRAVRLVSLFVVSLLSNGSLQRAAAAAGGDALPSLLAHLEAFGVEFVRVKEASALFKLIKGLGAGGAGGEVGGEGERMMMTGGE